MTLLQYFSMVVGYVALGVCWGFLRWRQYVDGEIAYYESERTKFLYKHRIRGDEVPPFLSYEWSLVLKTNKRLQKVPPIVNEYRGEIAFDVILWPISLFALTIQVVYSKFMHMLLSEYNRVTEKRLATIAREKKVLKGKQ